VIIVGSDKIGIIHSLKHGSNSVYSLVINNDFIKETVEDYPSEKIILFPWRDEFEKVKSGFFEDTSKGIDQLLSGDLSDENLLGLFRYIFNKKNNASVLNVNTVHKEICVSTDEFQNFLTDNNKFYFFDLKHLSNPKLIEWISERDPQWKNVSIPHRNSSLTDPIKIKIKNILPQIKEELGEDYLDYNNINNWPTFKHYYEFSKIFFESRKKSKQFLNFD
jgi:hypothetical protein